MSGLLDKLTGSSPSQIPDFPPTKRISTPAGERLSTILEYGTGAASRARNSVPAGGTRSSILEYADEGASKNSAFTTTSVWSESEKLTGLRANRHIAKRGGWRRLALIVAAIVTIIVALIVGLAVGLKKKHHSSSQSSTPAVGAQNASPTATSTSGPPVVTPSNFPLGSYSFVTFLDSDYTNCTANPATWTCYPYNTYYTNPSQALAVFNWIISLKPGSSNAYQISSTDNPFSISFQNADLSMDDVGTANEHYTFQLTTTKMVSPSAAITKDNSAAQCFFNQTTLQAYLYTREAHSFPTDQTTVTGASYQLWPARVRVEQVASGGDGVPNCYTVQNGTMGDAITDGLGAQDPSSLCSCLYKNWVTPT